MIAVSTYTAIGSEKNDGINTDVYFYPAIGYEIIDVLTNGVSSGFTADAGTGFVLVYTLLEKGDVVQCLYNR